MSGRTAAGNAANIDREMLNAAVEQKAAIADFLVYPAMPSQADGRPI